MMPIMMRDPRGVFLDYVNADEARAAGFHWLAALAFSIQRICDAHYSGYSRRTRLTPCYVVAGWRKHPHAHVRLHFFGVDPPMMLQWRIYEMAISLARRYLGHEIAFEIGGAPACREHEDCEAHESLGRECWKAAHAGYEQRFRFSLLDMADW